MLSPKIFVSLSAFSLAISVALGAIGAHVLEKKLEQRLLEVFEKGVFYQLTQSLGLLALALYFLSTKEALSGLQSYGLLTLLFGIIVFPGSLYVYSAMGIKTFAHIAPLGGTALIIAWLLIGVSFLR